MGNDAECNVCGKKVSDHSDAELNECVKAVLDDDD